MEEKIFLREKMEDLKQDMLKDIKIIVLFMDMFMISPIVLLKRKEIIFY